VNRERLTVAVTGLNATDNPGPGVAVLRSLRMSAPVGERLVGLTYDAMDPGIYAADLADDVFLMSYPSSGADAFLARLAEIHDRVHLDVIIPTLDAELPVFVALEPALRGMGIAVCLPSREQLELRSKMNLRAFGESAGIRVPKSVVVTSADQLERVHEQIPYPFFVKGVFYGASYAVTFAEALAAFHRFLAAWGGPVIVQAPVQGEELNLVALGDGAGGLLGAVAMKKLILTDKGKAWAGVTVRDPGLVEIAERVARASRWRGPFEVEAMCDADGAHHLVEINPRFPAWVHLASGAGANLPRAVVEMAMGREPRRTDNYEVGKMFIRIAVDQIVGIADFETIVTTGALRHVVDLPSQSQWGLPHTAERSPL